MDIDKSKGNNGLEGITFNPNDNIFYVLNEKKPGLLIKWTPEKGILSIYNLNFAKDYSGICYSNNHLWIVSDDSAVITKCDLNGNLLEKYDIPIEKAEGVVVDENDKKVYIISDATEELFVFEL